jgi:serine/threonine protein kinase
VQRASRFLYNEDIESNAANKADGATLPLEDAGARRFLPRLGARIGRYELIRQIGRGGMGVVFLARDTHLARRVAVKFLVAATGEASKRFLAEARATARCTDENIVVIHEVGEHEGMPYMVLEDLDGRPLNEIAGGRALTVSRAIELMIPVVRALVRAHESNIVHRDLKPQNVFVTNSGVVKVLDFGLAKRRLADAPGEYPELDRHVEDVPLGLTERGVIVGTPPYMSPEQWGVAPVDHRTDLWAVGIMLYELVTGTHPLSPLTIEALIGFARSRDQPLPRVRSRAPELPEALDDIIDRCLRRNRSERFDSAAALLSELEDLAQSLAIHRRNVKGAPYPGLTPFGESDAGRFFGRDREIQQLVAKLRDLPLVGVVGPSGVGKSSFIRAGLLPALRSHGDAWDSLIVRPGRAPLAALASLAHGVSSVSRSSDAPANEQEELLWRLRRQPGALGMILRDRCLSRKSRLLLLVDQFEELFTLVSDEREREAFLDCLWGAADDAHSPVRVVLSLRSDYLDRLGQYPRFIDELSHGLLFLRAPGLAALREALVEPLTSAGYRFEDADMVHEMVQSLEQSPSALPLLQFAAASLWEERDQTRRLLTRASYEALGGVAGALARQADEALRKLSRPAQNQAREIFRQLVSPEGTRRPVELDDLRELSTDTYEVDKLVDYLVGARLLVVQTPDQTNRRQVEIVHESLIKTWPTLRRWLEEDPDDRAFLNHLRAAASQWQEAGRSPGRLWGGEAMQEARHWRRRYGGFVGTREEEFLDAAFALAKRTAVLRRGIVTGTICLLGAIAIAATVALVEIRTAEQSAARSAAFATREAQRAREAERESNEQLQRAQRARRASLTASQSAQRARDELAVANERLRSALTQAERARRQAEDQSRRAARAAEAEREAKEQISRLAAERAARIEALERQRRKMVTILK